MNNGAGHAYIQRRWHNDGCQMQKRNLRFGCLSQFVFIWINVVVYRGTLLNIHVSERYLCSLSDVMCPIYKQINYSEFVIYCFCSHRKIHVTLWDQFLPCNLTIKESLIHYVVYCFIYLNLFNISLLLNEILKKTPTLTAIIGYGIILYIV